MSFGWIDPVERSGTCKAMSSYHEDPKGTKAHEKERLVMNRSVLEASGLQSRPERPGVPRAWIRRSCRDFADVFMRVTRTVPPHAARLERI